MLKVWGRNNSINVQKVLWCLDELNVPYERVDAGMAFGVVNTPEYRLLNPNGLVPTIEDDGVVLWESNAIVRYLAARYGNGTLWPDDAAARARADRWMDWQATTLWPNLRKVFWGLVRTPPEKRDTAAIETARQKTAEKFAIVDAQLHNERHLGGESLTIGDIAVGVAAYRWFEMPVERSRAKNLEAWYQRLKERPGFARNVALPLT